MSVSIVEGRLGRLEGTIEKGMARFVEVGQALAEIAREHLYRDAGFPTFALYCEKRWGMASRTAYYFIQASNVALALPDDQAPLTFTQAKELSVLSPAKQAEFVSSHPVGQMTRRELESQVAVVRRAELNLDVQETRSYDEYIRYADAIPDGADVIVTSGFGAAGFERESAALRPGGNLLLPCAPFDIDPSDRHIPGLRYHWTVALMNGSGPPITTDWARMYNMWTPVLWFVKGTYRGDFVPDVYDSLTTFIRKITRPNDVVVEVNSATPDLGLALARGRVTWVGVRTTDQVAPALATTRSG